MDIYDLTPSFQGLEVIVSMIQMLKQGYEHVLFQLHSGWPFYIHEPSVAKVKMKGESKQQTVTDGEEK